MLSDEEIWRPTHEQYFPRYRPPKLKTPSLYTHTKENARQSEATSALEPQNILTRPGSNKSGTNESP